MLPVSSFYPWVQVHAPSVPQPTMGTALTDAAIELCEDAQVLRQRLTSFNTVASTGEYTLAVPSPADQRVGRVFEVWVSGNRLYSIPQESTDSILTALGQPNTFYTTQVDSTLQLSLYPVPNGVYPVIAEVSLVPVRNAAQLADDLMTYWLDALVAGTLSRIHAIPDQVYSDPAKSNAWAMRCYYLKGKAKIAANFGRVRGSLRVNSRPFA